VAGGCQGSGRFVARRGRSGHDLGGDVRSIDGEYVFEDRGEGATPTTYSLEIDPGVWLPGRVKRMLTDQVMKRSAEDLERRIESDS
jgi:hypothetical protein